MLFGELTCSSKFALLRSFAKIHSTSFTYFLQNTNLVQRTMATNHPSMFTVHPDRYNGVTIDTMKFSYFTNSEFETILKNSLGIWQKGRIRGVWFKVPLIHSSYVPLLAAEGFEFHHAKKNYLMMTKWLSKELCTLPAYPHTHIGVAGLVVTNDDKVLVIKERFHEVKRWKFPGGYSNPGEDFAETAKREVLEETGINSEFKSILAFRHYHEHQFDCSDIYIVCLMKPLSFEIKTSVDEIADCKWMKIADFKADKEAVKMNKIVVDSYLSNREKQVGISITPYFSQFTNNYQKIYHIKPSE